MRKNVKERIVTVNMYKILSSSKSIFKIPNSRCQKCGGKLSPMVVVYDVLWSRIRKKTRCDLLCKDCMEAAMGRKIELDDLKYLDEKCKIMLPCNFSTCRRLDVNNEMELRYLTKFEFKDKYKLSTRNWKRMMHLYSINYLNLPPYKPLIP